MPQQKIFTKDVISKLQLNGILTRQAQQRGESEPDHKPALKIFNPYGSATWLLTESEPDEPDVLFGLCDLGQGFAELGSVRRSELEQMRIYPRFGNLRSRHGLPLERDAHFSPEYPLSVYVKASGGERIVEDKASLEAAAKALAAEQEQETAQ